MVYTIGCNSVEISKELNSGSSWKELVFAFFVSLPFFTHGIEADALTSTVHAGHFASQAHVPWSTLTYILAGTASAPVLCYVVERFGRKIGIFIISLVQGISCIPLLLDITEINIISLHLLAGISTGGLFTILPIYIREISSISNRGLALSFMMPMMAGGYLMKLVIGLEELTFLMVGLVAVQMLMVFCLLESPSYLVMAGKYERAKITVGELKCLPPNHPTVTYHISRLKDESDRAKAKGNLHIVTILKNTTWRDATKIGLVLHSTMILGGSIVFLDQNKTLMQLKLKEDPDSLLVLGCIFAGSLLCASTIRFIERKYLLTSAYSIMVLSMGILAIYTQADIKISTLRWVPVASLGVLVFGYGVAWGLPTIIITELFNCEIRAHQLCLLYIYSQLIKLAHVYSYPHIEDYVGIYTLFYVFVGVNLFGAVYCIFHVPDLKNKNSRQIERQLKRVPLLKM